MNLNGGTAQIGTQTRADITVIENRESNLDIWKDPPVRLAGNLQSYSKAQKNIFLNQRHGVAQFIVDCERIARLARCR